MAKSNKKRNDGRVINLHENNQEVVQRRKKKVELIPRNTAQEDYVLSLHNPSQRIVFAVGPAGTGKTYLAVLKAIGDLKEGRISKIVVTRPTVEAGEKIGYLPGKLEEKMQPWTRPIFDALEEFYSPKEIKTMIEENIIEICPLAFMRGRTFKDSVVIFDESQNATESQMKMALTRIGEGTRMFVTGDLGQSDFRGSNGLSDFCVRLEQGDSGMISVVRFGNEHVERDAIVTEVLKYYGDE